MFVVRVCYLLPSTYKLLTKLSANDHAQLLSIHIIICNHAQFQIDKHAGGMHIFNVPLPIIFNVLEYLSVEEVWELRTVCKLFYNICANYFKEKLRELFLNETWLYSKVFGRTIKILQNCTNLKLLTIELQHSISAGKILALFNDLQKAGCKLFECSLQGFSIPDYYFPNITENLLTVRKLCLVDLVCSDWRDLFVCLLQPRTQYTALQFLSLQLPRYDGVDLLYLGRNCPNVMFLNVSNIPSLL